MDPEFKKRLGQSTAHNKKQSKTDVIKRSDYESVNQEISVEEIQNSPRRDEKINSSTPRKGFADAVRDKATNTKRSAKCNVDVGFESCKANRK